MGHHAAITQTMEHWPALHKLHTPDDVRVMPDNNICARRYSGSDQGSLVNCQYSRRMNNSFVQRHQHKLGLLAGFGNVFAQYRNGARVRCQ